MCSWLSVAKQILLKVLRGGMPERFWHEASSSTDLNLGIGIIFVCYSGQIT